MSQAGPARRGPRRARAALLGLALLAVAILALRWWRGRSADAPEILAGAIDPLADHAWIQSVEASSHAPGHAPALVLDGRLAGALPYAWRPAGPGPAHLTLTWRSPVVLRGVVLDWAEPPARYELVLDDAVVPVSSAQHASGHHQVWLPAPQAVARLAVRIGDGAGVLAELAPVHDGMRTWLVRRDGTGDWEAEMLAAYGVTTLGRVSTRGPWRAVLAHARVVLVTGEAWDAADRASLRQFAERGGTVIELGPAARIADGASGSASGNEDAATPAPAVSGSEDAATPAPAVSGGASGNEDAATPAPAASGSASGNEDVATPAPGGAGPAPGGAGPARGIAGDYRVTEGVLAGVRWPGEIEPEVVPAAGAPAEVLVTAVRGDVRVALVTRRRIGAGQVIRWHGDLGDAVRRLRQGEPAQADRDVDGVGGIQPADLFAGRLTRADHDVPAADLLGFALLAQIASAPGPDVFVAALPDAAQGLLVLTADQDFIPADAVRLQSEAAGRAGLTALLTAEDIGARPDVSYDVAYARAPGGMIPRDTAEALAGRGHEIGVHPNLWQLEPGRFAAAIATHADTFAANYGQRPALVRNHHLVWQGYTGMARLHAAAGLRMNLDFMALAIPPHGDLGFMSASGLPMRFGDPEGTVLPILLQPTLLDDHVLLPAQLGYRPYTLPSLIERSRAVIEIACRHGLPVVVNHHPYFWLETQGAWQAALLADARGRGLAVWGAGAWLAFVERRRQAVVLDPGQGRFTVASAAGVTLLVEGAARAPRLDGKPAPAAGARSHAGVEFGLLILPGGRHELEP